VIFGGRRHAHEIEVESSTVPSRRSFRPGSARGQRDAEGSDQHHEQGDDDRHARKESEPDARGSRPHLNQEAAIG
jgi:hypothetical protein